MCEEWSSKTELTLKDYHEDVFSVDRLSQQWPAATPLRDPDLSETPRTRDPRDPL